MDLHIFADYPSRRGDILAGDAVIGTIELGHTDDTPPAALVAEWLASEGYEACEALPVFDGSELGAYVRIQRKG